MNSIPKYPHHRIHPPTIYTALTPNPTKLMSSLNSTIIKLGCIDVSTKLTPKYTTRWSCNVTLDEQFDFTTSIYNTDHKLVIIFTSYNSINAPMNYNMVEQQVVDNCPLIDGSTVFILDDNDQSELYPPHTLDSMKKHALMIETAYNSDTEIELTKCHDRSTEYHKTSQNMSINTESLCESSYTERFPSSDFDGDLFTAGGMVGPDHPAFTGDLFHHSTRRKSIPQFPRGGDFDGDLSQVGGSMMGPEHPVFASRVPGESFSVLPGKPMKPPPCVPSNARFNPYFPDTI